jgi:hypothetical protein
VLFLVFVCLLFRCAFLWLTLVERGLYCLYKRLVFCETMPDIGGAHKFEPLLASVGGVLGSSVF